MGLLLNTAKQKNVASQVSAPAPARGPMLIQLMMPNGRVVGEAAIDGVLEGPEAMRKFRALLRQVG